MKLPVVLLMAMVPVFIAGTPWTADALAQAQAGSGKVSAGVTPKDDKAVQKDAPGKTGIAAKEDADLVAQQKAAYALDTCVVTGKKLGEHGEPVEYLYKGRLVRFCCAGCIAGFEKDPAKYLAKLDEAAKGKDKAGTVAPKDAQTAEVWTCPMHPEVKEAKPGKCPKCGMNLVKAAAAAKK